MATYFKSDEYNFDSKQSLIMENKKKDLIESHNFINNTNNLDSINEAKDYLGCTGNKCSKIENNEVNNFKNPVNSNENNKSNNMNKNIYTNIFSDLFNNYGKSFVYFIYILFVTILLTYSILEKNNINLVIILILTLIFVLYNILIDRS
jgi:hypothetical protein